MGKHKQARSNSEGLRNRGRDELKAVSSWFRGLPPGKKSAIRELHKIRPVYNCVAFLFLLSWGATALIMHLLPHWPVRISGYVLIGFHIHGLANLMHEGVHGNLFRKSRWESWISFLLGAPVFVSAAAFRVVHLKHHQYNRSEKDPDEITNATSGRMLGIAFYAWLVIGMFYYVLIRLPIRSMQLGSNPERYRIVVEYGFLIAAYTTVFTLGAQYDFTNLILHSWIYPAVFTGVFANLRSSAEHMLTKPGHPLTQSRTVTSNSLLSFLNVNLNYHLEHHLFPGVPWYRLPRLHKLLKDEYREAGAFIYSSYLRFFFDAVRVGVHGIAQGRMSSEESAV